MPRPHRLRPLAAALALLLAAGTRAALIEEQFELPVRVDDAYGKPVAQSIRVTVFRDDAATVPQPLALINHGRAPLAEHRADMGRARYSVASRWFVRHGFVVALPTRVGYGVSGGDDVEDTGGCSGKRYAPGYAAAAAQTLALLKHMQARPDVRRDRALVLGQSFGGTTALAVAAQQPAGLAAAINFAGGGGGNPKTQPGRPCAPERLERLFADYGRTTGVPTLWVYTENDRYFGPTHPREWFDAFRRAGGSGEFVQFPPVGEDGHSLFTAAPTLWQPVVADFLRRHGYPIDEDGAR